MSLPSWVTQQNVRFNGTLDNAVVVDSASGLTTVILWDHLSLDDQNTLTDVVNLIGGTLPLVDPTAGQQTIDFHSRIIGATATGLSNISTATAGVGTINVGGAKSGGSATGYVNNTGNAGFQEAIFVPPAVGANASGLVAGSAATAGHQSIAWTGLVGANATGLANDTTAYTATITVDSVAKAISVVGSAAQTFTTLISEINTDLAGAATASIASATSLLVTSATTGATSTVAIVDGTLFAACTGHGAIQPAVQGVALVPSPTYTASIKVDGVTKAVSVAGSAAQTFTAVLGVINTALSSAGTAAFVGGALRVTSATTGGASTVAITAGSLFPALAGYQEITPPVAGRGTARTYSATVIIDGVIHSVSVAGSAAQTYTALIALINTSLASAGTASIVGGNLVITSATTGLASSVQISDSGFLFAGLTGYVGITSVNGVAPVVYKATITVDGVVKPISLTGNTAQTFTTLVAELNGGLGAAATAAIVGGNVVVTSATTGVASTVVCADGNLFKSVAHFSRFTNKIDGAVTFGGVLKNTSSRLGDHMSVYDALPRTVVGVKPAVPPYGVTNIPQFTYYGGDTPAWRYLLDDTLVNA